MNKKFIVEEKLLQDILNFIAESSSKEPVKNIVSLIDRIRNLIPIEEEKHE